jgi:putative transposase
MLVSFLCYHALKGTPHMTHQTQTNAFESLLELLVEHGFDRMAEAMTILLNEAMKLERTRVIGAAPYERRACY